MLTPELKSLFVRNKKLAWFERGVDVENLPNDGLLAIYLPSSLSSNSDDSKSLEQIVE